MRSIYDDIEFADILKKQHNKFSNQLMKRKKTTFAKNTDKNTDIIIKEKFPGDAHRLSARISHFIDKTKTKIL